jgi:hypothetical protein
MLPGKTSAVLEKRRQDSAAGSELEKSKEASLLFQSRGERRERGLLSWGLKEPQVWALDQMPLPCLFQPCRGNTTAQRLDG